MVGSRQAYLGIRRVHALTHPCSNRETLRAVLRDIYDVDREIPLAGARSGAALATRVTPEDTDGEAGEFNPN